MSEVIVRLKDRHIKVKGGEYVQEIVRCEECKHKEKCTMVAHHLTVGKGIKFVPITYCSAGERQTERSE